ncbi:MAG: hypothetical protein IPN64_13900 [Propionivibrio sp.]|nr:hypothetical protein [Propionivibrio sp.]
MATGTTASTSIVWRKNAEVVRQVARPAGFRTRWWLPYLNAHPDISNIAGARVLERSGGRR